jgi:acyl-CoA reductase-like NAD-dependent aldehyde dehydrogenase
MKNQVITLANDNNYGLCATVRTQNLAKGIRFTNLLHAGTVNVNTQVLTNDLSWGGFKESGFGRENSVYGLEEYTQLKLIAVDFS